MHICSWITDCNCHFSNSLKKQKSLFSTTILMCYAWRIAQMWVKKRPVQFAKKKTNTPRLKNCLKIKKVIQKKKKILQKPTTCSDKNKNQQHQTEKCLLPGTPPALPPLLDPLWKTWEGWGLPVFFKCAFPPNSILLRICPLWDFVPPLRAMPLGEPKMLQKTVMEQHKVPQVQMSLSIAAIHFLCKTKGRKAWLEENCIIRHACRWLKKQRKGACPATRTSTLKISCL